MVESISVIGLGNMGSALARALAAADKTVVCWTRSAERRANTAGFHDVRQTAAEAINASPVIVLCIANFEASMALLGEPGIAGALAGRTLIQLTSETPDEAEAFSQAASAKGIVVLDGAIATMPSGIGRPDGVIYYSGAKDVFDRELHNLRSMSGRPVYCGARAKDASIMDMAWLSFFYGSVLGLVQGIATCKSSTMDPSIFLQSAPSYLMEIAAVAKDLERQTRLNNFKGDQATNRVHLAGAEQLLAFADEIGLNTALPAASVEILRRTVEAGHADEEVAVAAKVVAGVA
ncbi:MAG: beta-hydroxyacid dehydrogenase [Devosia sp.]|uniref:imine reductase family protein n=1 Tax=Devosia sp. TaxID=1871048 RepID=UPI0026021F73|nr:NAD(P)-binding domain-containing protein [Devosia sp.]MDB5527117.1 beta-hydroxyacid dehydrogenase [Devosia sp.]